MPNYKTKAVQSICLGSHATKSIEENLLSLNTPNPYLNYDGFETAVLNASNAIIQDVADEVEYHRANGIEALKIVGLPVERNLPILDGLDVIPWKKEIGGNFLVEKILLHVSHAIDNPFLAYETRNEGSFFQDVLPSDKFLNTQTQKTDGELRPHNVRAAHEVRVDILMLHGLRSNPKNEVFTDYISGRDLIETVGVKNEGLLRQNGYMTPFDDFSKASNPDQVDSDAHAIIEAGNTIRYHHLRTRILDSTSVEQRRAFEIFQQAVETAPRTRTQINKGDLFIFPNKRGLHVREIGELRNIPELKQRWLAKAYAFDSTQARDAYANKFIQGRAGLVRELNCN